MAQAHMTLTVRTRRLWCLTLGTRLIALGYWLMHRPQWRFNREQWKPMYRHAISIKSEGNP